MAPARHSVEIARPAEDVFAYLVDGERMKRWIGGLREFTPLDGREPRLGSRARQRVEQAGRTFTVESEITELEPNERLTAHIEGKAFTSTVSYRLEPTPAGTRLTASAETDVRGLGGRVLGGVVGRQADRKLAADLARLKALLERQPS